MTVGEWLQRTNTLLEPFKNFDIDTDHSKRAGLHNYMLSDVICELIFENTEIEPTKYEWDIDV